MKKLIAVTIISIALLSVVLAGSGYIEITFRLPNAKAQEFLSGFLEMQPIPTIHEPNGEPNTPEIPQYTAKQWIKMCGVRYYMRVYRNGKDRLAARTAIKDPNIFE